MSLQLPLHWRMVALGECLNRRFCTVDPSLSPNEIFGFVGLEDIAAEGLGSVSIRPTLGADILSLKTIFQAGDILFGKLRPYLNKVALAPKDGICSTDIWAFKVADWLDPYFAYSVLSSPKMVAIISQLAQGANLPRVNAASFDAIQIPIPPLSEQRRIVEILREARTIRQLSSESDRLTARLIPAIFSKMFGDFLNGRSAFEEMPLGCVLEKIQTGWSPKAEEFPATTGKWGILKLSAVTSGRYNCLENKALPEYEEPRTSLEVHAGDVLISRKNTQELVGAAVFVWDTPSKLIFPDLIFRLILRADAPINAHFLWALLSHPSFRPRVRRLAAGAAGSMPNIPKSRLEELLIPVPPYDMQCEFQARIEIAHSIETQLESVQPSTLWKSLVNLAISGEITKSWRLYRNTLLTQEAVARDSTLKAAGVAVDDMLRVEQTFTAEVDRRGRELSREQMQLIRDIETMQREDRETLYFTQESLAEELDGKLRGKPDVIRRHLEVLAARGLVIPISVDVGVGEGASDWRVAYRRPHLARSDGLPSETMRQQELDRLARRIKELSK